MSIQSEIDRIVSFRDASLTAVANKGVTVPQDAKIDDLPDLIAAIQSSGMTVVETLDVNGGTIVTITGDPVTLQAKSGITPTTSSQTILPDTGYDGMTSVQINAIPSAYKDVSGVTATAGDVVSGKSFVNSTGTVNGSLVIQHYYTGSSSPSSSLGVNGDIYLKTS